MHLTVVTLFVRLLSEATLSVTCSDLCVFRTFQFCLTIIYLLGNIIPREMRKKSLPREMFTPGGEPTTEQNKDTSKVQFGEHITAQPSGSPDGEPQQVRGCSFCESVSQLPSLLIQAWGGRELANLVCLEDFLKAFYCLPPELKEIAIEGNVSHPPRTSSRLDGFTLEKIATQHHLMVWWLE